MRTEKEYLRWVRLLISAARHANRDNVYEICARSVYTDLPCPSRLSASSPTPHFVAGPPIAPSLPGLVRSPHRLLQIKDHPHGRHDMVKQCLHGSLRHNLLNLADWSHTLSTFFILPEPSVRLEHDGRLYLLIRSRIRMNVLVCYILSKVITNGRHQFVSALSPSLIEDTKTTMIQMIQTYIS